MLSCSKQKCSWDSILVNNANLVFVRYFIELLFITVFTIVPVLKQNAEIFLLNLINPSTYLVSLRISYADSKHTYVHKHKCPSHTQHTHIHTQKDYTVVRVLHVLTYVFFSPNLLNR